MKMQKSNPAGRDYPAVGANTTLGGASNQGRTVAVKQGLKNVNAAAGPRTGNAGDLEKRRAQQANRAEAAGLADIILDAYAQRRIRDHIDPRQAGISPDTAPRSRGR